MVQKVLQQANMQHSLIHLSLVYNPQMVLQGKAGIAGCPEGFAVVIM